MAQNVIDERYALHFLNQLNTLRVGGTTLANASMYKGYNLMQACQQMIFEDLRFFSKAKKYTPAHTSGIVFLKTFFIHGVLFSWSMASLVWAFFARPKVLLYSMDKTTSRYRGDFRIDALYSFFEKEHVSFIEIFHVVPSWQTIRSAFRRGRPAIYLETLYKVSNFITPFFAGHAFDKQAIEYSSFPTLDEQAFAKKCVARMHNRVRHFEKNSYILTKVLQIVSPKTVFGIDDYRFYHELSYATKEYGISYYAFQHGHYTKYHVVFLRNDLFHGSAIIPEYLVVWSDYWKKELLRLNSFFYGNAIIVGGFKELSAPIPRSVHDRSSVVVLIPYETVSPMREVREYIDRFLQDDRITVILKLRPDMPAATQLAGYGLEASSHPRFTSMTNTHEAIAKCDVVVGVYSTFLYDAIILGRPVGILQTSSDYGSGMIKNGIADLIRQNHVSEDLEKMVRLSQVELDHRYRVLSGNQPMLLRDTLKSLIKI